MRNRGDRRMALNKQTLVGKVISVSGNVVSVKMVESLKSTMPVIDGLVYRVGQIGSFLRIPLGYANLYGIVSKAGADAIPETLVQTLIREGKPISGDRWMTLVLVGERVGGVFERGVTQFPTAEDEVHLVTLDDLNIIYGGLDERTSIAVGNISVSESLPARLELDRLVTRHCAVLGATGSGKSNTVAILLEAIASGNFNSSRILLVDPHGEYNETLQQYSKVYKVGADVKRGESELSIPFWALPFDELLSTFPGYINDQQTDYIRQKVLARKLDAVAYLSTKPNIAAITSDSPIPFSLKELWYTLDDFERQTFEENRKPETAPQMLVKKGDPDKLISNQYKPHSAGGGSPFMNFEAKGILGFLDAVKNRMIDQRFSFLYSPGDLSPDLKGKTKKDLDTLLAEWLGHDRPITILDLSGVPAEVMAAISGALLKIVYDALFWGQGLPVGGRLQPLLLVLEEAHNYLKAGVASISSRTVQTIAKEGRKYGVGLLLVTQRPTELDETVLSQCGTVLALRMTNKGDRGHVSAAVQDELQDIVSLLPSLRTGEGLVMGEAVRIPSRIRFRRCAHAPKSRDPEVSSCWSEKRPNVKDYEKTVECWRNQSFKSK